MLPVPQPALGTRLARGPCKQRPQVSLGVNCKEPNACTLKYQLPPTAWTEGQVCRHETGEPFSGKQGGWAGPSVGKAPLVGAADQLLVRAQPGGGAIPVPEARTIMATVDTAKSKAMTTRAQRRDFMYIGSPGGRGGDNQEGQVRPTDLYISFAPTASAQTPG